MNQTLQERFRELRRIRGVSGVEMAEKMGVSKGYVSLIESGKRTVVDQAKLLKLASKLAVNSEWLLTGYGDPSQPTDPSVLSVLAGLAPPPLAIRETPHAYSSSQEKCSISVDAEDVRELARLVRELAARVDALEKRLNR